MGISYDVIAVFILHLLWERPITLAPRNVFSRSNTGIMDSNPTQGMDVCLC
jgi:hypothetical protein